MYLYDLWAADPQGAKLYKIVNDAVDTASTVATDKTPMAILVDINQTDVWVVNSGSNTVSQFRNGVLNDVIKVGTTPMGIAQAADGTIYVTNYKSCTVSKIVNGQVTMNIPVQTGPRGVCVSPDGCVWVSNYISSTVSKIVNDIVVSNIRVGYNPYGICSDKNNKIFVACTTSCIISVIKDNVKIMDLKADKVPYAVTRDSNNSIWFTNYYGGTVQKINGTLVSNPIIVGNGPFAIAPTKGGNIYVFNYLDGTISKISGNTVVSTIKVVNGNITGFGDFTGYYTYSLLKETSGGGGGTVSNITFDQLDPSLQAILTNAQKLTLPIASEDVSYAGSTTLNTVRKALDYLLYTAPAISGFTNSVRVSEIGSTVTGVTLSWTVNKEMASQTLTDYGNVPVATTSVSLTGLSLTADKDWTLKVVDKEKGASVSATTSLKFQNKIYFGTLADTSLTAALILSGLTGQFATGYALSKKFDATGGKYIYVAVPSSFNLDNTHFKVGGLANSDWTKTTIQFTNASGYTSSYDIFRSTNIQTGAAIQVDIA